MLLPIDMARNAAKGEVMALQQQQAAQAVAHVIEQETAYAFIAWLSQVPLDTLAGVAPREQTHTAYDHPLANWLSAQCGGMWSIRRLADGQPIAERWQDGQVVERSALPVWAVAFCDRLFWWSGRKLTSADCLSLL